MKVLWLVSLTLPAAALACGLPATQVGGGWLTGQLRALQAAPGKPELTVGSVEAHLDRPRAGCADGVAYAVLPGGSMADFTAFLRADPPDLVHIWGTEYAAAQAMQQAATALGIPTLVGVQGVMRDCAAHLCDGVPGRYLTSCWAQRLIDRAVPGALLDQSQARFDALAQSEAAVLAGAAHVTGRTGFDRRAVAELAPHARYWPCNETLRPAFYGGVRWQKHDFSTAPTLLLPQGNYPLKNLHTALRALPTVLQRWPEATLCVAGWPPLDKGPLLRPVIDWMFPYQRYCKALAAQLGVSEHLRYTGPLQAEAMRQAYLDADVFLLPSFSENSPNSLGEAMLLGAPCVASKVGGIPDLLDSGVEGLLYHPAGDADALATALCAVLSAPDHGAALGAAAHARAARTHDPVANAATLVGIYRGILHEHGHGEVPPQ